MSLGFSEVLTALRHERGLSQKQAAKELGISQALLSHYENGIREPRLEFVVHVCDYYGVTADFILGRAEGSSSAGQPIKSAVELLSQRLEKQSDPDLAALAAICFQNAVEELLYLMDNPGSALSPEMLIRQQQGFADFMKTLTEGE